MKEIQSHYSQLNLQDYVAKIKKTYLLGLSLTNKKLVWSFQTYFERFRREDIEEFTVKRMRGFPPGDNFLERFRIRPNAALIRNIALRTQNYTNEMHQAKIFNLQDEKLRKENVFRFDVSVSVSYLVHIVKSVHHLIKISSGNFF